VRLVIVSFADPYLIGFLCFVDRTVDQRRTVMPVSHHFGLPPFRRNGTAKQIRQTHCLVVQLLGAAFSISVEGLDMLFELSNG
jgi:hypothetical protein